VADLWLIYSKPTPANSRELWTLFLQCSCITAVIGGLFYNWLFASLEYSWHFSVALATSFSLLLLLTLFLVHPARCVFTMIMPTLGTKQGRKLLLSACVMIAAVNITPNIISNIKSILQVIQCICKNSSESLLNSTALLDVAYKEFGKAVQENVNSLKLWVPMEGPLQISALNNSFFIYQQIHLAGEKIGRDFLAAEVLVKGSAQVGNRLLAAFSVLYLCFESSWYLKNYLSDLHFDNFYITRRLEQLAADSKAAGLMLGSSRKLIRPTGLRLSREELTSCLVQAMLLSLALLLMLLVIAVEHLAFSMADTAVTKAAQFSTVPVALNIKYNVIRALFHLQLSPFQIKIRISPLTPQRDFTYGEFDKSYPHKLTFSSAQCRVSPPVPPNPSVLLALGLLFCILYSSIFLQTYARRLCRAIAAAFFSSWEEQRVLHLCGQLQGHGAGS
ncbi:OCSTP protein, partial [Psilopogon haemacephalus]|nr:OCSTP protein [Psilopogon haemacephalus]